MSISHELDPDVVLSTSAFPASTDMKCRGAYGHHLVKPADMDGIAAILAKR